MSTPFFVETITIGGQTIEIDVYAGAGGAPAEVVTKLDGITVSDVTLCFLEGTLISTPNGPIAVEKLNRGDLVLTASGEQVPVRWMGRRLMSKTFADPLRAAPVCIKADALGDGLPSRDLYVSPSHALSLQGVLVQAGALVNGSSIIRATDMPESYTYFHIELANHELVLAEGVAAETFVDNASRMNFDNWEEHQMLADGAPIAEMNLPRAQSTRQVPATILEMIAKRSTGFAKTARAA